MPKRSLERKEPSSNIQDGKTFRPYSSLTRPCTIIPTSKSPVSVNGLESPFCQNKHFVGINEPIITTNNEIDDVDKLFAETFTDIGKDDTDEELLEAFSKLDHTDQVENSGRSFGSMSPTFFFNSQMREKATSSFEAAFTDSAIIDRIR